MTVDIQELQAIHMSVQTADLNMIGFNCVETITLSCGLMNIGRGICSVTIKPSSNIVPKHKGSLDIEINRPYMRAIIDLSLESFLKNLRCGVWLDRGLCSSGFNLRRFIQINILNI